MIASSCTLKPISSSRSASSSTCKQITTVSLTSDACAGSLCAYYDEETASRRQADADADGAAHGDAGTCILQKTITSCGISQQLHASTAPMAKTTLLVAWLTRTSSFLGSRAEPKRFMMSSSRPGVPTRTFPPRALKAATSCEGSLRSGQHHYGAGRILNRSECSTWSAMD